MIDFSTMLFLLGFLALLAALLSGVPAFLAIGGVPLLIALIASLFGYFDISYLWAFPQRVFGIMANPVFVAIPLFVFMGVLIEKSGMAQSMMLGARRLVGNGPSGLSLGVLAVSTLIAATTGVVGATIIMLGVMAFPALSNAGVPRRLASGLVIASGTLGQIIPPSIVLIILADQVSNASIEAQRNKGIFSVEPITVSDLFAASLLPGLLLVVFYGLFVVLKLRNTKHDADEIETIAGRFDDRITHGLAFLLAPILLIFCVLGSILLGVATANEAASVGVVGAILLAYVLLGNENARLDGINIDKTRFQRWWQALQQSGYETISITGMIFAIVIAASMLSLVFRGFGGDDALADFILALPGERWGALLMVMLLVFLLGFVLEFIEIIFVVVPIAGPVLFQLDINPLWFAVLMAINLQTSFLTPPFGVALFYFRSVAPKELLTSEIYRSIIPFVILQLLVLTLVILFPQIALLLPGALSAN